MISFLHHQQCPACFVRLIWIVCEMRSDRIAAVVVLYPEFIQDSTQHSCKAPIKLFLLAFFP